MAPCGGTVLPVLSMNFCTRTALISAEQIPCIDLILYIVKTRTVAVRNNRLTHGLELRKIVDNETAEERLPVLQSRLINNDRRPFCLDPLHDALNR